MNDPSRVAVVGATGYAGFELAKLLLRHPNIEKTTFFLREGHANVRLPHGTVPATSRMGRSAVQNAFGRSRGEERRASRISFDAARSFARTRPAIARGESRAEDR